MKKSWKIIPFLLLVLFYSFSANFLPSKVFAEDFSIDGTNVTVDFKWKDRAHIELTTMKASSINKNSLTQSGSVLLQYGEKAFNADLAKNQKTYSSADMLSQPDKFTSTSACGGPFSAEELKVPGLTAATGQNQVQYPYEYIVAPSQSCNPIFKDVLTKKLINIGDEQNRDIWFTASGDTLTRVDNNQTFKQDDTNKLKYNGPPVDDCVQTVEVDKGSLDAKEPLVKAKFRTCESEGDLNGVRIKDLTIDSKGNPTGTGTSSSGTAAPSCESNNGTIIIGWLVCAFIGVLDDVVDKSTEVVDSLLYFNVASIDPDDQASAKNCAQENCVQAKKNLKSAWSVFRVLSSVSLLAVALIMIIGQAVAGE